MCGIREVKWGICGSALLFMVRFSEQASGCCVDRIILSGISVQAGQESV